MDVRNGLGGLKSLLGINPASPASAGAAHAATASASTALGSDRATFSNAGSEVSQTMAAEGIRMEKVASIQAALADGSYDVPASKVAPKVVDAMLNGEK